MVEQEEKIQIENKQTHNSFRFIIRVDNLPHSSPINKANTNTTQIDININSNKKIKELRQEAVSCCNLKGVLLEKGLFKLFVTNKEMI